MSPARLALICGVAVGCGGSRTATESGDSAVAAVDGSIPPGDGSTVVVDARVGPDAARMPVSFGPTGGVLDTLSFAIVGDTRPPTINDNAGYPTTIIQKIYQDIQIENPKLPFAVSTGDYMFATPTGNNGAAQLAIYLRARAGFTGLEFPAMGNHECTGKTESNCGVGAIDGVTQNMTEFVQTMLQQPLGISQPYYVVRIAASDASWTAKLVFIAPNAWSTTQETWFDTEMAKPTTYTFVVRHEGVNIVPPEPPGLAPSATIMNRHPYTLLLAGHNHTYAFHARDKEVVVGNGGAPLTTAVNYGYVVARQRPDGAIAFTAYDYLSHQVIETFAVNAAGSQVP